MESKINGISNRASLYSNIDMYNKSSQQGPEQPATVPSSMFPTFLKQPRNFLPKCKLSSRPN